MNRTASTAALTLALAAFAAPAYATEGHDTTTRTWYLPAGTNPNVDPFADLFPQTAKATECTWQQVDVYRYGTKEQRRIVDHLADDGLLTITNGTPEDSRVYLSHRYVAPPASCTEPTPTPTPTPTVTATPIPTPTATGTPSPEPTPTETPTPEPSETPTPEPSVTPTTTPTTTPSMTPTTSSTSTPSPSRTAAPPVATTPPTTPTTLAQTGIDAGPAAGLATLLLGLGGGLLAWSRRRKGAHQ